MQALETFEFELKNILKGLDCAYVNDIGDFIFAPSKRLRPRMIFASCNALNKQIQEKEMKLAIAIELLHCATLVHDDVIDGASIRRGKKSFLSLLGSHGAVLVGDYILSIVLKVLAELNTPYIFNLYSEYMMKVLSGEFKQMQNKNVAPSIEEYIEICACKTASLFELSLHSVFYNESNEVKQAILAYARNFGIAFQIKNDMADYENVNSDLNNGVYTLPNILKSKGATNLEIKVQCEGEIAKYAHKSQMAIENLEINKEFLIEFLGYLK